MANQDGLFLGTGWKFPPVFSRESAAVEMVSATEDIRESLWILLSTSPGERVMVPEFGCALWRMVFERLDRTTITEMEELVRRAILKWEPRVDVDAVTVAADPGVEGLVHIDVAYTVRHINTRSNLVFPFYINEATLAPPAP
jgi:phage baseplate assembly protein W